MSRRIIPRDLAARQLAVSTSALARYESLGLVQAIQEGSEEGYEPAQVRRLWSIVTYQRDLGINLAGVEVILRLRDQLVEVHRRLGGLADELRAAMEPDESPAGTNTDE
jgi:MerR family transcriptional regulator/heat shock protein HspR